MKNGTQLYDERNDRYITLDGVGANPKVWRCIVEETDYTGNLKMSTGLFTEYELKKFNEVV